MRYPPHRDKCEPLQLLPHCDRRSLRRLPSLSAYLFDRALPHSILAYAMRMNHRLWREIEASGMWTHEALAYLKQASSITTRPSERGIGFPIRIRQPMALARWFLLRQSHLT